MKRTVTTILALTIFINLATPCTSVIISGKHTPDGRPLMWKHRDTQAFDNKLVFINDGTFDAIALVNSDDPDAGKIWIGFNSAGFSIMNTLSYNIEGDGANNGSFMREALTECETVEDFENFIEDYPQPRNVRSNFGVIDAQGGAAFFETGHYTYTRFDADDKRVAPHGYIVRTNFSFDGEMNEGAGYIRFGTAEKMFYKASGENNLSLSFLLEEALISLENSLTGQNAREDMLPAGQENYIYFQDCINRFTSTSSLVVQGVKEGESPLLTTMWSMIGFPLGSVAIPVWLTPGGHLPETVTAPGIENSEICDFALEAKSKMIPSRRGSTQYYINTTKAFNADNTGITQQLLEVTRNIYKMTAEKTRKWQTDGNPDENEIRNLYSSFDRMVREAYGEVLCE